MQLIEYLNRRSRKLSMFDWKLAQGAAMCVAVVGVKLFPRILEINVTWLAALALILYVKPLYVFYFRR